MRSVLAEKERVKPDDQEQQVISEDRVEIRSCPETPLILHPEQRAANEHFGILRARLLKISKNSQVHSFLVTSPQRQDGKSYTSVNLAISFAQLQQERVLLIDGDLRLRGLTHMLRLKERPGLADFLRQKASLEECVKATSLSHLCVLPAGNVQEDGLPAILEGFRWPEFLEATKQQFELVVVDSVPVSAPIADFELLLNACDAALLVVGMRRTSREAVDSCLQRVQHKLLGVIVNRIEPGTQDEYSEYAFKKDNS
jgi:capsular exopolysaccharide synthesis family protein